MQTARKAGRWFRRRWWLVLIVLIVGLNALTDEKPQWYLEETAVMEQVAGLLDSPVPYERLVGWSWARHVTFVVLPRVELDEAKTRRLANLLRELPSLDGVNCHYISEQKERVEQLRRALAGHAGVYEDLGASSEDKDSRQERTHVAGVHRPGLLLADGNQRRHLDRRFEQRLKTTHFRWATNLPVNLIKLDELAEQAWSTAHSWLRGSEDAVAVPEAALPIYLCASLPELRAVQNEFRLVRTSFFFRPPTGGYYPSGPLVAVIASPRTAPQLVAHEVVHAAVERVLPDCPDPLNEGAAMLLTERLLGDSASYATLAAERKSARRRGCAALDTEPLSLQALFSLDYRCFHDTRDGRNYWLSLELVRVLDRENDARFPGALQGLVRALARRRGAEPFVVFSEVYPLRQVEALWKEQLRNAGSRGTMVK